VNKYNHNNNDVHRFNFLRLGELNADDDDDDDDDDDEKPEKEGDDENVFSSSAGR